MPEGPVEPEDAHDPANYNLILETDLDPRLAKRWWG